MNIYSWNVNGIRSALKKDFEGWFNSVKPDILCLQEVRAEKDQIPESITKAEGYYSYWNPCARKKGYSGVGVLSQIEPDSVNYGFDIEEFDNEGRVLQLVFPDWVLNCIFPMADLVMIAWITSCVFMMLSWKTANAGLAMVSMW